MINRYHIFVEGRVQGVGFRGFCMSHALEHGLTGSVRNLENGLVEIFIQGEEADCRKFLLNVQKGDRYIRVDNISVKETAVDPKEKKFRYEFGGWGW